MLIFVVVGMVLEFIKIVWINGGLEKIIFRKLFSLVMIFVF